MIEYPKINTTARKIAIAIASWYNLGRVNLDYSDSVKLYCEIIPKDRNYLKVRLRITVEDRLSIYEDINGGLEHRGFVKDIAKYLESINDLDLGEIRVESWGRKERKYKLDNEFNEKNCFNCKYRSKRGFCNLLGSWYPKKNNNIACEEWVRRKDRDNQVKIDS